jgi:hypothetical protein
MDHSSFADLPARTQSALQSIADAVDGVVPIDVRSWRIPVSDLPSEPDGFALLEEVAAWAGQSKACLYYFECLPHIDLELVEQTFAAAKASKVARRAYPRLNKLREPGACLYVGGSQSVAKRLRDHLGYGAKKTYALQLIHWAGPLSLEVEFVCAKYSDDTPSVALQALEDTLWETSAPMLGRRGRR